MRGAWHAPGMPDDLAIHTDDVPAESRDVGALAATRGRVGGAVRAKRLRIARMEIAPGRRSTPPHAHAEEDEAFLVLAGSGLSWQSSSSRDVRTYEIGVDDLLWHPSNGDAHTLIAGEEGLTVLIVGEGSRADANYLPRTKSFWLGARWSPADGRHPFAADAQLGPLEVPEPTAERPPTIRNLADLPL